MKRFVTYIFVFLATISFAQNPLPLLAKNNPMPTDTLRILMIGNSFTEDATEYIGGLIKNSPIDSRTCCVYVLTQGGAELKTWCLKYEDDTVSVSIRRKGGNLLMPVTKGSVRDILHQQWDIVSIQQVSMHSNNINTFIPWLQNLIGYIQTDCTNEAVKICWHETWSYDVGMQSSGPKGEAGWYAIVSTVEEVLRITGIELVIPSGTAIQNARNTMLNTPHSLTRDGQHIAYGVGQYLLACTVYEALFSPVYGVSVLGNNYRPLIMEYYKKDSRYEWVDVTDEFAEKSQICAQEAVNNWNVLSEQKERTENVSIFPNPTADTVFIFLKGSDDITLCSIYDNNGKRVFKEKIPTNKVQAVDISKLKRGIYSIQLKSGETIKIQKLEKL